MNPFQRARQEALATRERLAPGRSDDAIAAKDLLASVESALNLAVEPVDASYPDLGGGSAVLERVQRFIYVSKEVPDWGDKFCGLVAHEIGHWFLDATKAPLTVAHLKTLFGSDGSPATLKVEAYGARERQELQANVFARELLIPRTLARQLALGGDGPCKVASKLGIPVEFVRQQMLDALLLPNAEVSDGQLHPPSPDQLAAAQAQERAANVVAGPGTGKTSTLIHRVKHLIEVEMVDPSAILVLTFTNKAAFELVERLRSTGIDRAADVWAGTFHAFGLEFLRKFHQRFNLESDLRVADRMTTMTTLVAGLPQLNLNHYLRVEDPYDWLSSVVDGIKRLKEELVSHLEYRAFITANPAADPELQRRRSDVATLYEAHEALLAEQQMVDFVDLISKPALALQSNRVPFAEFTDRFQYILVDEYQDVTQAMVELLRQLAVKARSIWVVGDIRQAIHHWRGASLKSLLKFDSEFKAHASGTKIQRYPLDINRRSAQEILDLVGEVGIQHTLQAEIPLDPISASNGYSGEMPTVVTCAKRNQVLGAIVEGVQTLHRRGIAFGSQAVLCRSGDDVRNAAGALSSQGVPVIYIGELAQRPEVKHLLCLMQLLVERQPRALIGLVDVPGLAMPLADILRILEAAEANVCYQRGRWLALPPPGLSETALNVIAQLGSLLDGYRHSSNPWAFVCDMLLEHHFGLPDSSDDAVAAWIQRIALWQFAYAVRNGDGEMKEARLSRFLMRQRLRQRIGEAYVDRELPPEASALDGVRLLTVHGSKGLEFDAVHLGYVNASTYGGDAPSWAPPGGILDIVPPEVLRSSQAEYNKEAAVERNNLLYVAVSRAKRHLRIYQDTQFGDDSIAPQLRHYPQKYQTERYNRPAIRSIATTPQRSFTPASLVNFEHFDSYVMCALQYWYAQVLQLRSEADIDVSVRARLAVMRALKAVTVNPAAKPVDELLKVWIEGRLPAETEDSSLWRDASYALSEGLGRIKAIVSKGGQFAEPTSVVGSVTIQMPWGFLIKNHYGVEFAMMRFARRRVSDLSTVLKPIVNGLDVAGPRTLTLNHILSDKIDSVGSAKRIDSTKSYLASVRMEAGDNEPTKGRHCGRCAFLTICPAAPLH
ncbi:UvrD-helicase domain-containing protein [Comamonas thiooxydans]|uniref:UvrD-helicase domain-containing protein n=1 Tax=Comamonas thiooxydans TaxID=363952 RepID=UPI00050D919C|nr:UvrD-helicase domain-containing protein [Comamonas thiooxydans]KGG96024.1 ATPase AAA [Comamonas thiooxydans]KGH02408.1 ATPase AAA [Comamonas thiooxydans]KGH09677.1 ATPase AAA [Comamonas thiooxydans]KGH16128.1 ATPase AAA [Comamonas thiooxydans]TZG10195.1 AAA family ATPase [Comamonas thiooxydans]